MDLKTILSMDKESLIKRLGEMGIQNIDDQGKIDLQTKLLEIT